MLHGTSLDEHIILEKHRNIQLKHMQHQHCHARPPSEPARKLMPRFSRWLGNILIHSGEKLLRHAG
jgi:hypothetical protein